MITAISWARESNQWDKNEYTLDEQDARHAHLLSLTELAARIADRLDTAPPEIQRQILEALPFRYTLQGEILL